MTSRHSFLKIGVKQLGCFTADYCIGQTNRQSPQEGRGSARESYVTKIHGKSGSEMLGSIATSRRLATPFA